MTNTSKTLIFFGNERLASGIETDAPILRSLIESGYDIPFIVVSQGESSGRKSRKLEVIELAEEHDIEVKFVARMADLAKDIANNGASFGVLAAFGRIVPQTIIDLFEHGILNIHPSLLPEFRGSSPIESAILRGQSITGVSLMNLSAGMDEGQVYGFAEVEITPETSKQELYEKLSTSGAALLIELLPKVLDGSIIPMEQDHENATYSAKLSKENAEVDWSKSAEQIGREIRAQLGWPGSKTQIAGKELTITEAKLSEESGTPGQAFAISKSRFGIYCGEQALEIIKLKPAGKSEMTAAGFMAGNKVA